MRQVVLLLLPVLLCAAAAPAAEEREVTGRVLDAQGKPVAGIEVASYWYQRNGRLAPRAGVETDREGRFQLKVRWQRRARSLMALDAARARGASVLLDEQGLAKTHTLRLAPLVTLRGALKSTGLGYPPEQVFLSATAKGAIIAAVAATGGPTFALPLPAGSYR
ncbi:MAG: Ig-like domain-containing protein, partial [Planctomycetota bacterium]